VIWDKEEDHEKTEGKKLDVAVFFFSVFLWLYL